MMTMPRRGAKKTDDGTEASTSRIDRLADAADAAAQAKRWQARKNGMTDQGEASEVRNLTHDADAKAQAEAAMQQMMAKAGGKPRRR
jgi:hypothetical protein